MTRNFICKIITLLISAAVMLGASSVLAQERSIFGQKISEEIKLEHESEFKGARKVAISAFNVAFPSENHFTASAKSTSIFGGYTSSAEQSMDATMTGVDKATQQRITDKAYALFVSTLTAAGFEVVDQAELAKLAPEFAKWESSPNFSVGRYGAYVAPTGLSLRFLRGDAAKRDTSGIFGNLSAASRTFDSPLAFSRSPYVAHDAHLGLIAVTLVVDFGTFTRSTPGGNALTTFSEGVAIGAGNVLDSSSLLYYWGTDSGGFPAHAHVQKPIQSKLEFADVKRISETIKKGVGSKIVTVTADPLKFETAADEVVGLAIPKLVNAIYVSK